MLWLGICWDGWAVITTRTVTLWCCVTIYHRATDTNSDSYHISRKTVPKEKKWWGSCSCSEHNVRCTIFSHDTDIKRTLCCGGSFLFSQSCWSLSGGDGLMDMLKSCILRREGSRHNGAGPIPEVKSQVNLNCEPNCSRSPSTVWLSTSVMINRPPEVRPTEAFRSAHRILINKKKMLTTNILT